jgi:hypothetical protein
LVVAEPQRVAVRPAPVVADQLAEFAVEFAKKVAGTVVTDQLDEFAVELAKKVAGTQ